MAKNVKITKIENISPSPRRDSKGRVFFKIHFAAPYPKSQLGNGKLRSIIRRAKDELEAYQIAMKAYGDW